MLVFDRRSLRCVVPPTEDCDVPTTPAPQLQDEEDGPGGFPNLPPGALPVPGNPAGGSQGKRPRN